MSIIASDISVKAAKQHRCDMTPSTTISRLVSIWYTVIGGIHHKDRDCHFRLVAHWQYSGELFWEIDHHGYLMELPETHFVTYEEAETALIGLLKEGIRAWIDVEDSPLTPARRTELMAEMEAL